MAVLGRAVSSCLFVLGVRAAQLHMAAQPAEKFDDQALLQTDDEHRQQPMGVQWDDPSGPWQPVKGQLDKLENNICAGGKQLPDLYVLGVQKCGTSTLARLLAGAGVHLAHGPDNAKELHFFNMPIKVDYSNEWEGNTGKPWQEYKKKLLPMIKWEGSSLEQNRKMWQEYYMPACPAASANSKAMRRPLADFTPDYVRIVPKPKELGALHDFWRPVDVMNVSLPEFLLKMYGPTVSKKLQFVMMIREPMAQMQSSWYMSLRSHFIYCRSCKGDSFASTLQQHLSNAEHKKLSEWVWTAMYARQLEQWVGKYSPEQFYILPLKQLAKGDSVAICKDLADRMNFKMTCTDKTIPKTFGAEHPSVEQDVPADSPIRGQFARVMDRETDKLVQLLTSLHGNGAKLAGYSDAAGHSQEAVRKWLLESW